MKLPASYIILSAAKHLFIYFFNLFTSCSLHLILFVVDPALPLLFFLFFLFTQKGGKKWKRWVADWNITWKATCFNEVTCCHRVLWLINNFDLLSSCLLLHQHHLAEFNISLELFFVLCSFFLLFFLSPSVFISVILSFFILFFFFASLFNYVFIFVCHSFYLFSLAF